MHLPEVSRHLRLLLIFALTFCLIGIPVISVAAPVPALTPTAEPEPEPTDTPVPEPTDTPMPEPTDTPVPEPTDTPVPPPTDTPIPPATDTPVPPVVDPVDTATPMPEPEDTPTPLPPAVLPVTGGTSSPLTGVALTLAALVAGISALFFVRRRNHA